MKEWEGDQEKTNNKIAQDILGSIRRLNKTDAKNLL